MLEEFNEEEPKPVAIHDVNREEEELEDYNEYEEDDEPLLMNEEEAEQFLVQAGIQFKDYGEFDELESNTVSLNSPDDRKYSEWEYESTSSEEEGEEYNDPTPSMRAYALKYWYHPRRPDTENSSDSDSGSKNSKKKWYTQLNVIQKVDVPCKLHTRQSQNRKFGHMFLAGMMAMFLGFVINPVTTTTHENVIFESIGEMAGATSYLHVQVTISLSSITQQFELYKSKLQARFTDPHKGAAIMNQQFAKNLNISINGYLESRQAEEDLKRKHPTVKVFPAPHMNTAVIWSRIAQLHYEDLYAIGLHLTALKNLLPLVPLDNRDRVVAASNFFTNIQPNL
jgi:hypothetical protein